MHPDFLEALQFAKNWEFALDNSRLLGAEPNYADKACNLQCPVQWLSAC